MSERFIKPKTGFKNHTLKFDNRMTVSFSNSIYEGIRKWSYRKGISAQDFHRKAAEFYINHLEQSEVESTKFKKQ